MHKKPHKSKVRLIFTITKWRYCECGCGEMFRFSPMWERDSYDMNSHKYLKERYSIFHMKKKEFDATPSFCFVPEELPMEELRSSLEKWDYMSLPYNVHLFTIHVMCYDGPHCFYIYRIQEIPGCQASSQNMQEAKRKLTEVLRKKINEYYAKGEPLPLPQQYDKNFVKWD